MNDFSGHNPAKVYVGKNQREHLPEELAAFGTKVLMGYGGGSIKKSGLYDEVRGLLEGAGMELFELAGVEPNPRHTTANRGAAICRQNGIDVVLAVGGGSAIDCAKGVAAAAKTADGDVWPLVAGGAWVTDALPVAVVLTHAATGAEMDAASVIPNLAANHELGLSGRALTTPTDIKTP